MSRVHEDAPYVLKVNGEIYRVDYEPGESSKALFGGNSNWRGPVWLPVNFLLIEALERYHHFYGDDLKVELPTGSGHWTNLKSVAHEIERRLTRLFLKDASGRRAYAAGAGPDDPHWSELILFYEYFHADTGRGLGASHQTGWTALIARCLEDLVRARAHDASRSSTSV
jgi:hypothetical protein